MDFLAAPKPKPCMSHEPELDGGAKRLLKRKQPCIDRAVCYQGVA